MMNTMKAISTKASQAVLGASLWAVSTLAAATNDLPGGPAVNQLDLHPPVTKIAADQHSLHYLLMGICLGIFVLVSGWV